MVPSLLRVRRLSSAGVLSSVQMHVSRDRSTRTPERRPCGDDRPPRRVIQAAIASQRRGVGEKLIEVGVGNAFVGDPLYLASLTNVQVRPSHHVLGTAVLLIASALRYRRKDIVI